MLVAIDSLDLWPNSKHYYSACISNFLLRAWQVLDRMSARLFYPNKARISRYLGDTMMEVVWQFAVIRDVTTKSFHMVLEPALGSEV